jgi:hypothetical protein
MPTEPSELPKVYRWMSRYGPILLCAVGITMVLYAMLADKPDAVSISLIVLGVGSIAVGVLLPRIKGPVELGTGGVKAELESVHMIDALVAATAETVAEVTIPDQPDKEAKVAHQIKLLMDTLELSLRENPPKPGSLLHAKLHHPSQLPAIRNADPELQDTYARFSDSVIPMRLTGPFGGCALRQRRATLRLS